MCLREGSMMTEHEHRTELEVGREAWTERYAWDFDSQRYMWVPGWNQHRHCKECGEDYVTDETNAFGHCCG